MAEKPGNFEVSWISWALVKLLGIAGNSGKFMVVNYILLHWEIQQPHLS